MAIYYRGARTSRDLGFQLICAKLKPNWYNIPEEVYLNIGAIIFPGLDQTDFTAPSEVLSRLPNSTFHILWKERVSVKDVKGLILTPEKTLSQSPPLELLLVPGGYVRFPLMSG